MVEINFSVIQVNEIPEGKEIVFPYGDKWYRLDWDKVPPRFKHLYVTYLKLLGREIPEWLSEYETDTITVSNVNVDIDLDNCEEIPEEYPMGV